VDDSTRPAVAVSANAISAVSWAAILAGAAVAVATSLVLFTLATGVDLASMAPSHSVATPVAIAAIGLVVTQWVSAALGGYVTGRLRTRWTGTHTHEVFFRDTAHGLITWCVATIVVASGVAAASSTHTRYFGRTSFEPSHTVLTAPSGVDGSDLATPAATLAQQGTQVAGELVIPAGAELARTKDAGFTATRPAPLISARTAVGHEWPGYEGTGRVRAADAQALEENEGLRRDAAATSVLTSLAMLIGAFIACVSAALGGRLRDEHP
jgi:hypothetical protein